MQTKDVDKERSELRFAAMNLLARREHSRQELERKLSARCSNNALLAQVLDQLVEQGLQSEQRFAEAFVRSRITRGQGLYRIQQELRQRGVDDSVTGVALEEAEIDWFELARETALRRFGGMPVKDPKERAKRMRFLQYRGFSSDQIQYAMS